MPQVYEDYWSFTLAWTDFNGNKFLNALRITKSFIDEHKNIPYSGEKYTELQKNIQRLLGIDLVSVRKGINQLVKMGFVNFQLNSYHELVPSYLDAPTDTERRLLLSKIVYSNSSFARSVTTESSVHEIGFLIRTIEHIGALDTRYICAIMKLRLEDYPNGYITLEELKEVYSRQEVREFTERKYNQIAYLHNLLNKLDGVIYNEEGEYYTIGVQNNIQVSSTEIRKTRDSYLQRIYKRQLEEECKRVSMTDAPCCMVEGLAYPVLIASHIKPYSISDTEEQFDPNNGLLLSKNIDSLFDLKYISFDDEGNIICYSRLSEDIKTFLQRNNYKLNAHFLNTERKAYLATHRNLCERANQ